MKNIRTAIIGGGASGMFCAAALQDARGAVIFERGERLGKKLSATGNGQGNVTNLSLSEKNYFSVSGDARDRLIDALARHGRADMLRFLESLGGLFLPDERGRVYPAGRQASSVTDLLRFSLAAKGVEICTDTKASALIKTPRGFRVEAETPAGRECFEAERVVLCAGGKAAKNFGTDGGAYLLAKSLGHSLTPLYPSLVQLKTDTAPIRGLKGIRVDARVSAYAGKEKLAEERGDVIFTDYGLSGDAVFRISAFLTDKLDKSKITLKLEFLPDVPARKIIDVLTEKSRSENMLPEGELLCGIVNNQLGRAVMRICGTQNITGIVSVLKEFALPVTGSLGFDYAQVTKGGVPLSETDNDLQSRLVKGLYFAGEILDVDGECGGYNLQWAYTSARIVADALNKPSAL